MTEAGYTWQCDECSDGIADGEGYLIIDVAEVAAAWEALGRWEQKHRHLPYRLHVVTRGRVMDVPGPVKWRACHAECDPGPAGVG